jgi:O-antigen/teichoic acid export membrane protein
MGAAAAGYGIWSLVLQRIVAAAMETGVLWLSISWRPRRIWSRAAFADVWQFGASRGLEGLLQYVDLHGPRIILGRVAGAAELGYFVLARRIIENTINVLLTPAKHAALPAFATVQTEMDRVRRGYASGVGLTTAIVIPACAGIGLVAPELIPLIAGAVWMPSVILLQILVLTAYRRAFHIWNAAVLRGLGRPGLLLYASFVRTFCILLGVYLLSPWGAVGTCVAIVAGQYVSWPIAMMFVRRITGLGVARQLRPGIAPLASVLLMAGAVTAVRVLQPAGVGPAPWVAVLIGTGVVTYGAAIWFLGREQCQELLRLVQGRKAGWRPSAGGSASA